MRIGFLTPEYPNENLTRSGGLGTSIRNLALGLIDCGIDVFVFVIGQDQEFQFNDSKIQIYTIPRKKPRLLNWYFEAKRIQNAIQKQIHINNIDLIEAPDWTGITAFMRFSIPVVLRLHGSDGYFCHLDGRKQKQKNRFLEKRALLKADKIVSVSQFTAQKTTEVFQLPQGIVDIVPNGINVKHFKPLEIPIINKRLLYFGTIVRKKGVLELAHMFNILVEKEKDVELIFLGKDNIDVFTKTSTKDLILDILTDKAIKKVQFISEVPYSEVKKYIASAHVITLPSFAEAFPMTWLESLAMEKALVSSDIGWAKELMVHGKTGFTVNPINHDLYADYILKLFKDLVLCAEMGKKGREHVINHFSNSLITKKNIKFYKKLLEL